MDKLPKVEEISLQTSTGTPITTHKAIWNPEDEKIFAITSDKYKLVRHEDVLTNIEDVLAGSHDLGNWTRAIRMDKAGGRLRATYRFEDVQLQVKDPRASGQDLINPTIEVFNSYDLSWRHTVTLGAFRLVCSNGLTVGETLMKFRKRHMPDLYLDDVKSALEIGVNQVQQQAIEWSGWSEKELNKEDVESAVEKLALNKKETKLLLEEEETASNLSLEEWFILLDLGERHQERIKLMTQWMFFNILTQFITHRIESVMRKTMLENKVRSIFY